MYTIFYLIASEVTMKSKFTSKSVYLFEGFSGKGGLLN